MILASLIAACTSDPLTAPPVVAHAPTVDSAQLGAQKESGDAAIDRVMLSNRFGYVWADQQSSAIGAWYAPSASYSRNALGLANRVRRNAIGHYQVSLAGMLHPNLSERVSIMATAYGSTANRCVVGKWTQNGAAELVVNVACIATTGAFSDSRFTLLFVGNGALAGRHGFARAEKALVPSYSPPPAWSHTTGSGPITAKRFDTGYYQMDLSLFRPANGLPENYFVTTIGSPDNHCNNNGWGTAVFVRCY
ncbi:MAG: hypothetical protein ABI877_22270, partial [Gemmatimonadaceae bacterium]